MVRELKPVDVTDDKELRQLAEEVERTGLSRRLQRGGVDVAVIVPARPRPMLADPDMDRLRDHPRFKRMVADAMRRTGVTEDMIPIEARRPSRKANPPAS